VSDAASKAVEVLTEIAENDGLDVDQRIRAAGVLLDFEKFTIAQEAVPA
jgi:hypothetical protein